MIIQFTKRFILTEMKSMSAIKGTPKITAASTPCGRGRGGKVSIRTLGGGSPLRQGGLDGWVRKTPRIKSPDLAKPRHSPVSTSRNGNISNVVISINLTKDSARKNNQNTASPRLKETKFSRNNIKDSPRLKQTKSSSSVTDSPNITPIIILTKVDSTKVSPLKDISCVHVVDSLSVKKTSSNSLPTSVSPVKTRASSVANKKKVTNLNVRSTRNSTGILEKMSLFKTRGRGRMRKYVDTDSDSNQSGQKSSPSSSQSSRCSSPAGSSQESSRRRSDRLVRRQDSQSVSNPGSQRSSQNRRCSSHAGSSQESSSRRSHRLAGRQDSQSQEMNNNIAVHQDHGKENILSPKAMKILTKKISLIDSQETTKMANLVAPPVILIENLLLDQQRTPKKQMSGFKRKAISDIELDDVARTSKRRKVRKQYKYLFLDLFSSLQLLYIFTHRGVIVIA